MMDARSGRFAPGAELAVMNGHRLRRSRPISGSLNPIQGELNLFLEWAGTDIVVELGCLIYRPA